MLSSSVANSLALLSLSMGEDQADNYALFYVMMKQDVADMELDLSGNFVELS